MLKEVFIRKYDDSSSAFSKYTLKHDTIRRPYYQFSRQAKLLGVNCQFLQVARVVGMGRGRHPGDRVQAFMAARLTPCTSVAVDGARDGPGGRPRGRP